MTNATPAGPRDITRDEALAALDGAREFRCYDDAGRAADPAAATVARAMRVKGARIAHWGTSISVVPRRGSATRYVVML